MAQWNTAFWTTEAARATWEPRIQRIAAAWSEIERASVAEGVREACLQSALPQGLAALSEWAGVQGLVVLPMGPERVFLDAAPGLDPRAGKRWNDRVAIMRSDRCVAWLQAWRSGDDEAIGRSLGVPSCCIDSFRHRRGDDRLDPGWAMAREAVGGEPGLRRTVRALAECNVLLRSLGVRLVPHLPCSFTCGPSSRLAAALATVGVRYGHAEALQWAREMLSWPVECSVVSGKVEITTPAFRLFGRTEAMHARCTIRLRPVKGPAGARGGAAAVRRYSASSPSPSPSGSFAPGFTTKVDPKRG